jgi:hypothetical protein
MRYELLLLFPFQDNNMVSFGRTFRSLFSLSCTPYFLVSRGFRCDKKLPLSLYSQSPSARPTHFEANTRGKEEYHARLMEVSSLGSQMWMGSSQETRCPLQFLPPADLLALKMKGETFFFFSCSHARYVVCAMKFFLRCIKYSLYCMLD